MVNNINNVLFLWVWYSFLRREHFLDLCLHANNVHTKNCLMHDWTWTEPEQFKSSLYKCALIFKKKASGHLMDNLIEQSSMSSTLLVVCSMTVNAPYLALWPGLSDFPSPERRTPPSKLDNLSTNFLCSSTFLKWQVCLWYVWQMKHCIFRIFSIFRVWEIILPEYRIAADDKRFPAGLFFNVRWASPQPCKTAG